ncbi:MAG: AmmeMemoRadiSam system protein A [Deltaproteobacteria bacterium]|nr:AmmeMemoRadiSam system protein A [Deltaproteobacteria bacterium]
MDPTSSAEGQLSLKQRTTLLEVARASIVSGLEQGRRYSPDLNDYPPRLREQQACFVTLHLDGELRGCVGSLRAHSPLVEGIAQSAYSAAFRDPRFPPLCQPELKQLHLHISALSVPKPMQFADEADLLSQLRPGIDGLVLTDGGHVGTFLPAVWEKMPEPAVFFAHLRAKAGLSPGHWSNTLKVERYTTESFD